VKRAVRIQTQQATPKPALPGGLRDFQGGGAMEEAVRAAVRFAAERAAETELFQNFKYLWHFVAAYGEAAEAPPEISPFKKHPQVL
jgi:hypothetical protein